MHVRKRMEKKAKDIKPAKRMNLIGEPGPALYVRQPLTDEIRKIVAEAGCMTQMRGQTGFVI